MPSTTLTFKLPDLGPEPTAEAAEAFRVAWTKNFEDFLGLALTAAIDARYYFNAGTSQKVMHAALTEAWNDAFEHYMDSVIDDLSEPAENWKVALRREHAPVTL